MENVVTGDVLLLQPELKGRANTRPHQPMKEWVGALNEGGESAAFVEKLSRPVIEVVDDVLVAGVERSELLGRSDEVGLVPCAVIELGESLLEGVEVIPTRELKEVMSW